MTRIISIETVPKSNQWKKAIDGSDDTYWTVYKETTIEIKTETPCNSLSFEFQKGFQAKKILMGDVEYSLEKSMSCLSISVDYSIDNKINLIFKDSYDPHGRIIIYNIEAKNT